MSKDKVYCPEFALCDGIAYDRLTEMLFCESDGVNLYAEKSDLCDDKPYFAALSPVISLVKSAEENDGVLKITFDACAQLKEYFIGLKSLCATLKDLTLKYAPFIYFTNTEFTRLGEPLVSFFLKSNQIRCDPSIAQKAAAVFAASMPQDPDYRAIKRSFSSLPDGRKRYYLNTGIRLLKNLYIYSEREKCAKSKDGSAKFIVLTRLLPKNEWLNAAAYKRLAAELFCGLADELAYCECFADISRFRPKIDRCVYKLEFYLRTELNVCAKERIYYS